MMKPVSVELKKQIDNYSAKFLEILEKWIHKDRGVHQFKKRENGEVKWIPLKTIGQMFCNYDIGYTQFADLLMACRKANCVDEFKLYIAYKGSKERSDWKQKLGKLSLAEYMNDLIAQELKELAKNIERECSEKREGRIEDFEIIYQAVLDKFLGYLYWGVRVSGAGGGEIKCLKA